MEMGKEIFFDLLTFAGKMRSAKLDNFVEASLFNLLISVFFALLTLIPAERIWQDTFCTEIISNWTSLFSNRLVRKRKKQLASQRARKNCLSKLCNMYTAWMTAEVKTQIVHSDRVRGLFLPDICCIMLDTSVVWIWYLEIYPFDTVQLLG